MKFGVVIFPGSNCDHDMIYVLETVMQQEVVVLWHKNKDVTTFNENDWIILPGGFSYGDYLRAGAIARFSPIMQEVIAFANNGGHVLGVCNGFQVLCEAGLLPGVLVRNINQKFICKNSYIKSQTNDTTLTSKISLDKILKIPIAHAEGRFFADTVTLDAMKKNDQITFRYCDETGVLSEKANLNGTLDNIAGVCNKSKNVFGMMPHPERAADTILSNTDGKQIFESMISFTKEKLPV